jgi:integration host factor subunit beta
MNRADLITRLASQWHLLDAQDVEASVATILSALSARLAEGGPAEIRGFGSFSAVHRPPGTGRNPKTGRPVPVPAKYRLHFKLGAELRQRVDASTARRKTGAGARMRKREEMERVA